MAILKRFCCCMSLRTGGILIGILGMLFMISLLIVILTTNVKLNPVFVPDPSGLITKISIAIEMIIIIFVSLMLIHGAAKETSKSRHSAVSLQAFQASEDQPHESPGILQMSSSPPRTRKKLYLVPWLVVSIVTIAGIFITNIYSIALMFHNGNTWGGVILIVYSIVVVALAIYCWLVVYSLYQELASQRRRK